MRESPVHIVGIFARGATFTPSTQASNQPLESGAKRTPHTRSIQRLWFATTRFPDASVICHRFTFWVIPGDCGLPPLTRNFAQVGLPGHLNARVRRARDTPCQRRALRTSGEIPRKRCSLVTDRPLVDG
jgi:hypothetical protein